MIVEGVLIQLLDHQLSEVFWKLRQTSGSEEAVTIRKLAGMGARGRSEGSQRRHSDDIREARPRDQRTLQMMSRWLRGVVLSCPCDDRECSNRI